MTSARPTRNPAAVAEMTGLHDEGSTKEPRRSKRLERSCPNAAAAPPPARRTRRDEGPVPPRERNASVPAATATRSPLPPHRERDSEEGVTPARRTKAPVPPPKPDASAGRITMPRTAYVLRNRVVPDTSKPKPKPIPPARCEKREEPKRGRSWQTPMCARVGLEHYNSMNQGDEHELVKPVSSTAFVFNGIWFHANFLAKRKGATNCVDLVPKYFFAEIVSWSGGHSCVSCVKLEPGDPKNIGGCGLCSEEMIHPAGGGYHGAQTLTARRASGGLQISFEF